MSSPFLPRYKKTIGKAVSAPLRQIITKKTVDHHLSDPHYWNPGILPRCLDCKTSNVGSIPPKIGRPKKLACYPDLPTHTFSIIYVYTYI